VDTRIAAEIRFRIGVASGHRKAGNLEQGAGHPEIKIALVRL